MNESRKGSPVGETYTLTGNSYYGSPVAKIKNDCLLSPSLCSYRRTIWDHPRKLYKGGESMWEPGEESGDPIGTHRTSGMPDAVTGVYFCYHPLSCALIQTSILIHTSDRRMTYFECHIIICSNRPPFAACSELMLWRARRAIYIPEFAHRRRQLWRRML